MLRIWEGTDVVCCYNVADSDQTKRIRLVQLPENPNPEKVLEFARLFQTILPVTHSLESIQILTRTRFLDG